MSFTICCTEGIILAVKDDSSENSFPTYAKENAPVLKEYDPANYKGELEDRVLRPKLY